MKKPDPEAKIAEIQAWVDDEVRPYLQHLLNVAQAKLRSRLSYNTSGEFELEGRTRFFDSYVSSRGNPVAARFPELQELDSIARTVNHYFKVEIGTVLPTVRPRRPRGR